MLDPRGTWADAAAYDAQATKLARMFVENFKTFAADVDAGVIAAGPQGLSVSAAPFEPVIGLEIHAQLLTRDQDLLRLPHGLRRPAEHARLPGVPRAARARCRC